MPIETVTIKKDRIPYLEEKIAKLNRKCHKLNCPDMILTVHHDTEQIMHELVQFDATTLFVDVNGAHIKHEDAHKYPPHRIARTWVEVDVTLEYEIPVIDGWELISTFDIMPGPVLTDENGEPKKDENGNRLFGDPIVFTSTVPDKGLPAQYHEKTEIHCDHCGHKRYRTHSMLMRKLDDGGYREVGSTCIKDFFGHSPKAFLWMAQISFAGIIREVEDDYYGGNGSGTYCYDLNQVLAYTALAIRNDGWVSKGAAYDDPSLTPTVDNMYFYMNPPSKYKGREDFIPTEHDRELAAATIKYFSEIEFEGNDYLTNCVKLVKLGYVPVKFDGVACSMIATYKRELAKDLEKKDLPKSDFVGEVKDKIEVEVKVVFTTEVYSDYGPSSLYIFVDETTGNKFKTFYSGKSWEAEMGDYVTLKGTVKKHETYKGEKATMLTRCFAIVKN